jgi:hypothetical protein
VKRDSGFKSNFSITFSTIPPRNIKTPLAFRQSIYAAFLIPLGEAQSYFPDRS